MHFFTVTMSAKCYCTQIKGMPCNGNCDVRDIRSVLAAKKAFKTLHISFKDMNFIQDMNFIDRYKIENLQN